MKRITFDESRQLITVEMGARWSDVYSFLQQSGTDYIPVGGGCTAVGVAGFVLGGGYSFVSRSYGLACDSLLALTIVTADGVVRAVSPNSATVEERDLFWACQGGGGGNFGVVLEMTLRVYRPPTTKMLAASLFYGIEHAADLICFYNEWAPSLPSEIAVYGYLGYIPDPCCPDRMLPILRFQTVYNGDFTNGMELIRPLLERRPLKTELYNLKLPDYLKIVGGSTAFKGRRSYTRSGILLRGGLTSDFVRICLDRMKNTPSLDSFMLWMHQGGKTNTFSSEATAFPHRTAEFIFELAAVWNREDETRANVEWAFQAGQELAGCFSGAYVNYIDPLLPNWQLMYYGQNYPRLLAIKRLWDPDDYFSFQQSIGSTHTPSPAMPLNLEPLNRTVVGR